MIATLLVLLVLSSTASAFTPPTFALSSNSLLSSSSALSSTRKPFIAGNWKLNPQTRPEAVSLAHSISSAIKSTTPCEVAIFVPSVFIEAATDAASGGQLQVGAELSYHEAKGAFTGAVSAEQLKSVSVQWALAGHSERRTIFGESDADINKQVTNLLSKGMSVMLCIGETKSDYDMGLVEAVCTTQLKKGLAGVKADQMERVVVAYEPVWAIGTGLTCPPSSAQAVHQTCRKVIDQMFPSSKVAQNLRILYGGSVTPETVDELMGMEDVDGALVGGASLDANKFGRIINFEARTK
jgi:triosephosphate isomerase